MCPLFTNIQKYSIHDGQGIRTTVFFKGCPLRCAWCHNPETQSFDNESWDNGEDAARVYTVGELIKEILKDRIFYEESGGGVTLSGGEVLAQDMDYLDELLDRLKDEAVTVFIDTCGAVEYSRIERVRNRVSAFLYDLKLMDEELHRKYTGTGNKEILDNLKRLSVTGADIYIRIPMIKGLSADDDNIKKTIGFLKENGINCREIDLLPYHDTGSGKYERLGREYTAGYMEAPDDAEMERFAQMFRSAGFVNVKAGG